MFAADPGRNRFMLRGALARRGYDWWWHNFTARHAVTGVERAFSITFFVTNPGSGGAEPVFAGAGTANPTRRPAYGLVKIGIWGEGGRQLHRYSGTRAIKIAPDRLDIEMAGCRLSETASEGEVLVTPADAAAHPEWASDAGRFRWQLSIGKQIHYSVGAGASAPARALNLFEMYWHAEGIKTLYSGWVELDGERYEVTPDSSFGYADKNWGRDFTSPWLWLASSDLVSLTTGRRLENSALEIGGGRPRVLGVALPNRLLAYFAHEGRGYDFNFSKPWQRAQVRFGFEEAESDNIWRVVAENREARLEVDLACRRADMLQVRYQSPDGARRHPRLWNGGTGRGELRLFHRKGGTHRLVDRIAIGHAGCEYGEYDATGPYRRQMSS
jgi:tocopherol cyclase